MMRMRKFVVVMAAPVVAMMAFSGFADAGAGKAKQDLVQGGGTSNFGGEVSYENIRSEPNGKNPDGRFEFRTGTFFVKEKVKCLRVKGNRAVLSGKITKSNSGFPFGTFTSFVEDNGNTEDGTPDKLEVNTVQSVDPGQVPAPECPSTREPGGELEDGNIKVRDAK